MLTTAPRDASHLVKSRMTVGSRVLLFGDAGVGKSVFSAELADACAAGGLSCTVVSASVGNPAFGPPGALSAARRRDAGWQIVDMEGVCTLDAARFRLPITLALARLVKRAAPGALLIDTPGVTRGMAGAELLSGLIDAAAIDEVWVLTRDGEPIPLAADIDAARGVRIPAASQACRPAQGERRVLRTRSWDDYLTGASSSRVALSGLSVLGAPPPAQVASAWRGRQVALCSASGTTLALGEVIEREGDGLLIRSPSVGPVSRLVIRDAWRDGNGLLVSAPDTGAKRGGRAPSIARSDMMPSPELIRDLPPISTRVASARVVLTGGILGDPLLHVRFRHQRRSLLFDLGDAMRLQAKITHQITDVFISHAHIDHIAGFFWLLRTRIGINEPCRIWGPPGLADRIEGLLRGIEWDRVGDRGPCFEVAELHGHRLQCYHLQAGRAERHMLGGRVLEGGVILEEPELRVRAVTLDHGTPTLAYALEEAAHLNVRKERLVEDGLEAGPWLRELKTLVCRGELEAIMTLPNGAREVVRAVAGRLLLERPGDKLVYATDFADTRANRRRIVELARGAHTLFCEAAFCETQVGQARATGHLTARACGEIAAEAAVGQLVPFHLSRRYERQPETVLREVVAAFERIMVPDPLYELVFGDKGAQAFTRGA